LTASRSKWRRLDHHRGRGRRRISIPRFCYHKKLSVAANCACACGCGEGAQAAAGLRHAGGGGHENRDHSAKAIAAQKGVMNPAHQSSA